jgi:hypothetical protein
VQVNLYWQVESEIDDDYTTTVQLFDENGVKLAQDDHPPGGVYYPTSLWKAGEVLIDRHTLSAVDIRHAVTLLAAMYRPSDLAPLAPPLEIGIE